MIQPPVEPFRASTVKIARAKKHISELEGAVAAYFASEPVRFTYDPTPPDGMKTGFQFRFEVQGVPDEMGAIIGDIIHNLRAALDLLASDLCRISQKPTNKVYFPFCEEEGRLDEAIRDKNFDRCGQPAVRLLRELKPYRQGNVALRALHDLDILDKHQMLIPGAPSFATPILELHDGAGNYHRDEYGNPKPKIVGDPNKPSHQDVQLPPGLPLSDRPLLQAMQDLVELTASIVEAFKLLSVPAGQAPVGGNG